MTRNMLIWCRLFVVRRSKPNLLGEDERMQLSEVSNSPPTENMWILQACLLSLDGNLHQVATDDWHDDNSSDDTIYRQGIKILSAHKTIKNLRLIISLGGKHIGQSRYDGDAKECPNNVISWHVALYIWYDDKKEKESSEMKPKSEVCLLKKFRNN